MTTTVPSTEDMIKLARAQAEQLDVEGVNGTPGLLLDLADRLESLVGEAH
jgi:hypothetical protein